MCRSRITGVRNKRSAQRKKVRCALALSWGGARGNEFVSVTPHGFDDTSAQFAPELVDHAGDPCPAGVKGVRRDSLIDLAGGEHLPRPAGQQKQNIKLHRRQLHRLAGLPHQPALRIDLQRAKEQRCVCGGGCRGKVCDRREGRYCFAKKGFFIVPK